VLNLTKTQICENLIEIASFCARRNLVPATSGNFSARLPDKEILITVSGRDKAALIESDFLVLNSLGFPKDNALKPSAEVALHLQIYRIFPEANYIAHFHSSSSAVLSKVLLGRGIKALKIEGYELLKALSEIDTHEHTEVIPIFPNSQDMDILSDLISPVLDKLMNLDKKLHAYILAGHGLYTWGVTKEETLRHVDALNTLIESYLLELNLENLVKAK